MSPSSSVMEVALISEKLNYIFIVWLCQNTSFTCAIYIHLFHKLTYMIKCLCWSERKQLSQHGLDRSKMSDCSRTLPVDFKTGLNPSETRYKPKNISLVLFSVTVIHYRKQHLYRLINLKQHDNLMGHLLQEEFIFRQTRMKVGQSILL